MLAQDHFEIRSLSNNGKQLLGFLYETYQPGKTTEYSVVEVAIKLNLSIKAAEVAVSELVVANCAARTQSGQIRLVDRGMVAGERILQFGRMSRRRRRIYREGILALVMAIIVAILLGMIGIH